MIKKRFLLFIIILIVSCNTNKSIIQTTKKDSKQNSTSVGIIKKRGDSKTKNSIYKKTETLEATSRVKVTSEMIQSYINNYKSVAQANMKKYSIPASIILGQALLESGSGVGTLCVQANNHFGIKCNSEWTGESVRYNDDAIDECFRKYTNPIDSFRDHSLFLSGKKRYSSLFNLNKTDYKSWAKGLKEAGYATDELYPSKLITIIEKYQLYQYDTEIVNSSINNDSNSNKNTLENSLYIVEKGDTIYSISKKYNISIEELKKSNNLIENTIAIGQTILIIK
ncbi:glucosaminidase domain-containing protein [Flavobacterium sp.]|uniref:glucosaminidase domain-containing protein n=1 Tax=Flavobacterium sp. TaxID=239 RepID=UPI0038FCAE4F